MFLMIDNYDSFVYNLVRYFKELDEEVVVYRNDKITIDKIKELNPTGIILSPGPKSPRESNICLKIIEEFKGSIPILGICLGHQCIGYVFNSNIIKGEKPVHGKVSKIKHNNSGIFKGIKNPLNVTRYHSLKIDENSISDELNITALTEDNVIMAVEHKKYPIWGVQFHPEAVLTECGHEILSNFIEESRKWILK